VTKKPICPIGIDCPVAAFNQCTNLETCENQTYPWDIPYEKNGDTLTVKRYAFRHLWRKQGTNLDGEMLLCPLPSGQYLHISHDTETESRIMQAWEEAGWKSADLIPQPKNDSDEIDPIPF
jgi:hypothetical protein